MKKTLIIMSIITAVIGIVCFIYGMVSLSTATGYVNIMGDGETFSSKMMYVLDASLLPVATAFVLWAQSGVLLAAGHLLAKADRHQ